MKKPAQYYMKVNELMKLEDASNLISDGSSACDPETLKHRRRGDDMKMWKASPGLLSIQAFQDDDILYQGTSHQHYL